jgi:competence protein ComEA
VPRARGRGRAGAVAPRFRHIYVWIGNTGARSFAAVMPDVPRSHLAAYALAAVVVLVLGVRQVAQSRAGDRGGGPAPIALDRGAEADGGGRVTVHVAGEVRRPGVYRLRSGARVDDAVRRAGGARPRGDLTQVNLAQELEDGRQIVVPRRLAAAAAAAAAGGAVPAVPAGPINLNTATLEQLDTLDGIGPATAQSILDFREEQGGFSDVEQLDQVPGIGPATMEALRDEVTA